MNSSRSTENSAKPNILLIMVDDMGFSDLGCYGGEIRTPNLDRLASNGLRFTQFYNNALCAPTRASLLTGLYSQQVSRGGPKSCVTIAEVLKAAGYRTLMAGKWHLSELFAGLPVERGFDRYYGLVDGCCNFFNPGLQRPGEERPGEKFPDDNPAFAIDDRVIQPYTPEDKDFYTTDAFTDYALGYLDEYGREDRPFFLYVAYTAPHYPLHAWPRDIAKYKGKYKVGWDRLREQRLERMVEMGLIDERWALSARDPDSLSWEEIEDRDAWDLKMAVYAAMIDRVDQNVGRLQAKLRELGIEENTLVLFLSDNGASDEDRTSTPDIPPGPAASYRTVDLPWANLSNTPFRKFKRWNHEGGISTPFIAHWPRVIQNGGEITHQIGHLIDVMATCTDIAGAEYPSSHKGVLPLEGKSLLPIFRGEQREGHRALYWNQYSETALWRAVRMGKWKLVSPDYWRDYNPWRTDRGARSEQKARPDPNSLWELYDMEVDRTEVNDLADQYPDLVKEMAEMYDVWERHVRGDSGIGSG
ncbi:MAG: arylsulfatase [Gemmatimonadota bacterium]|nr:arylsulfatase [Gemmatimonadota bacterium]